VLYIGGFMGPFGGGIVNTMLPELADGLDTTVHSASLSITWYLAPMAALLLVSGTIATRFGAANVVRIGYAAYAVSSLACALITSLPLFLGARAVQGAANAFLTPVLIALVVAASPPGRQGRALGGYAAAQAAGQAFSPLAGGLAAAVDWRLAFYASAVAALLLAVATPSGPRGSAARRGGSWRSLFTARLGATAYASAASQVVSGFLLLAAALIATDRFGLEPVQRGLVVVAYGVAGMVLAPAVGAWADRAGIWTVALTAGLSLAVAGFTGLLAPSLVVLVAAVFLCGIGATSIRIASNTYAMASAPTNGAGATSIAQAAQFAGGSFAPALLPLFARSPLQAGIVLALVALSGMVVVSLPRAHRQKSDPGDTMES
jgi:MFS family permease